jgi:two-component system CheB/CheR fusion protein
VLIYLDRELQEQVCGTFHYALNPGGFLMLGGSESADTPAGLFRSVDRAARLYQSTAKQGAKARPLPSFLGPVRMREPVMHAGRNISPSAALNEAALHRRAIERVAPPSMLVDDAHRVLHMSDTVGRFVSPSGGPLSGDVVDLVRSELRFELRSALNRLFEQNTTTLSLPILVRFNGNAHRVQLLVKGTDDTPVAETNRAIVMFIEGGEIAEEAVSVGEHATSETVRRLTQELELTQSRLRTVREESDAANEELRAANEELQSINEEYRSTSEELETSKEELQSINEELQTVNTELKHKLDTISRAHSDLQNLMAATDFGTLFLDAGLRIKRFTDQVTRLFSVTPADEGRPITDFAHQLNYEEFTADAQALLANLIPIQREVSGKDGRWYDVRMRPYRTVDDKIDGVVISIIDVTDRRAMEEALRESEERFRSFADASSDVMWIRDAETLQWEYLSPAFEAIFGIDRKTALAGGDADFWQTLVVPEDAEKALQSFEAVRGGERTTVEYRIVRRADGETRWLRETQFPILDGGSTVRRVGGIVIDITDEKFSAERLGVMVGELQHRTRNLIAVVQSLASQSMDRSPTIAEFRKSFSERLMALSRVQGLLSQSQNGISFGKLLNLELEALGAKDRVTMEGPRVLLPGEVVQTLALALHELATNARKYGALASKDGHLAVNWRIRQESDGERFLTIAWEEDRTLEQNPQAEEAAGGYGRVLIEKALPYSMGAETSYELGDGKLRCTIDLPLDGAES